MGLETLKFPHDSSKNDETYRAKDNREYKMIELIDNKLITSHNLNFYPKPLNLPIDNPYKRLFFIDLFDPPFISCGDPFTIDITMQISVPDPNYFNKSRVYFSLGQNVTGVGGNIITVGTDASDPSSKNKPCIGILTKDGYMKSPVNTEAIALSNDEEYNFKLVYNPAAEKEQKLILFMKEMNEADPVEVVQSIGRDISSTYNFEVTKPRLYFYTSGWTNEYGWNDVFDYAYARIHEVNEGFSNDDRPIKITNRAVYSTGFLLDNLANEKFEVKITHSESTVSTDDSDYASGAADSLLTVYSSAT